MTTRPRGYTLVELMVVTGISVLLMTVLAYIYANSMKLYQEAQGIQEIYDSSAVLNRDLRDAFSNVVPIPGAWITPRCRNFPGVPNATSATIDPNYITALAANSVLGINKSAAMSSAPATATANDFFFSYAQRQAPTSDSFGYGDIRGHTRPENVYGSTMNPEVWYNTRSEYSGGWAWWMPGFFGQRDGATAAVLEANDVKAGSWGWPRPDYRMNVDLNDPASPRNVACWFYTEYKSFSSPSTIALDNPNIVLLSIKFSVQRYPNGLEESQLSFLRHHIGGVDFNTREMVREDQAVNGLMQSFRVTPYYMTAAGTLAVMNDAEHGCGLNPGEGNLAGGFVVPKCFDIEYSLRHRTTKQLYRFALRVFNQVNPQ